MTWKPILSSEHELRSRAWDATRAVVKSIYDRNYPPVAGKSGWRCPETEALLFAYWGLATNDPIWIDRAEECLNTAIENASAFSGYLGLHGGLCGLGWIAQHLSQLLDNNPPPSVEVGQTGPEILNEAIEDPIADIDSIVLNVMRQPQWNREYDLISGLVGYGVYFLERLPSVSAAEGLKLIIGHFASKAEHSTEGITWYTPKQLLPEWHRELFPDGYYNLGVAHGIPGILYLLGETFAAGIEETTCLELLDGALSWLLSHQAPPDKLFRFYSWMAPGRPSSDSRLVWCYGDPGLLPVLLQLARRTSRCDWHHLARGILDQCLSCPIEQSGIADAALCHGAAGTAHLFNRIYQLEGDHRFLDASLGWFERALAMRQPGTGVGGFLQLTKPDPAGPVVWEPSSAFLGGASGIALALLAALTPVEPQWDRLLLASGRSVRGRVNNCIVAKTQTI